MSAIVWNNRRPRHHQRHQNHKLLPASGSITPLSRQARLVVRVRGGETPRFRVKLHRRDLSLFLDLDQDRWLSGFLLYISFFLPSRLIYLEYFAIYITTNLPIMSAPVIPPGSTIVSTFKRSFVDVPIDEANGNAVRTTEFLEAAESLTTIFGTTCNTVERQPLANIPQMPWAPLPSPPSRTTSLATSRFVPTPYDTHQ